MNAKTRIASLAFIAMLFGSTAWADDNYRTGRAQYDLSLIHISEPTRPTT